MKFLKSNIAAAAITIASLTASAQAQDGQSLARGPVPIAFEGGHELGVVAARQRLLSQKLGYDLTVDEAGKVTDCELDYQFRRRATQIALCRPFLKHMTFEPALDQQGNPTTGSYRFVVDFNMMIGQDGYLEERFRN